MKKSFSLLLLAALAACDGDSTGSKPSLAGQWIFRMRTNSVAGVPMGCQVYGTVRLAGSGSSYSGRMPVPEASCSSALGIAGPTFDSTTTLTAQVEGDSVLLTLHAYDTEIRQVAQVLGDSLAGHLTGGSTGTIAARRYPDSVPLDRATVQLTGAVTRTVELYGYGAWNGLRLVSSTKDEAVMLLATAPTVPPLTVGTYAVGHTTALPLGGTYARLVNGTVDEVQFTTGTLTITQADAQLLRGSFDVTGTLNAGSEQVRVQGDFTIHRSGYPQ